MIQDKVAIMQVLGGLLNNPPLLSETESYQLSNSDFPERFHKIIFATINNLYLSGVEEIDEIEIDGFLSDHGVQYEIFNQNDGIEYLRKINEIHNKENFSYHYNRLKKFSLVREMKGLGFDISEVYDNTILDPIESENLSKKFDSMKISDILNIYEEKILEVKDMFESDSDAKSAHAGEGVHELLGRISESPEIGLPMNSEMLTSVFRGSRKKKYYLRSSITGGGKSRHMIGDALRLAALGWYDSEKGEWVKNDFSESVVVITTEMLIEELQTPSLAYISDVEEHKILDGTASEEEKERLYHAANILEKSNLFFEELPNFDVQDISRTIEKNIIKHNIEYVFFDYIHSTPDIFLEASGNGVRLREDQILLLMSNSLKAIANKYDVYLMSATQLNGEWKEAWQKGEVIDSNYLQGSKAISQKTDGAMIVLPISKKERKETQPILEQRIGKEPTHVTHVFKNRGNPYDSIKIFSHINMGTMRIYDLFPTDLNNELVELRKLTIKNKNNQEAEVHE